ncbi:transmembrane protein [Heterostelium album PN500]|uniref:P-type phospholipid transporter n=1 Tax=Heterostelium pallidum (strain ATCC 26659 / Pp 5 / PN500) TaxID=670386 RepID=D3B4A2_HETP5|nr:transmembrane protein [Heterostelium album PN500]EFA84150.1 transmembrane protein [Heterostelium album PN500]|eukprot:XP_020436267.1 transmembrane protein [Heterostelium album PN500]
MKIKLKSKSKRSNNNLDPNNNCYTLYLNDARQTLTQGRKFPNNYIRTTKYTLLTFLPKNLFEQFRRLSNFYFFSRYLSDKTYNKELFNIVRENQLVPIFSEDLRVGDIVKISNGQRFPADLVLLSSTNDDGICYVETSNLDGKSIAETSFAQNMEQISSMRGSIVYELPNERLYRFNGRINLEGLDNDHTVHSLNHTMFLQRGSQLRNTKHVFAAVAYTGIDTKMSLNQQPPPSKFSTVEKFMNRLILYVFIFQICICLIGSVASSYFEDNVARFIPYLGITQYSLPTYGIVNFFTYFILFNTMIPISLWVTMEVVKMGQAWFMQWDLQMAANENGAPVADQHCKAKTSSINEDLGRIQHIFSDKTGTLTENIMRFCKCSIGADLYDERENPGGLIASLERNNRTKVQSFLRILALCHTVIPEIDETTGETVYQSQSPDELALVQTAKSNGFIFLGRKSDEMVIRELGVETSYALLAVLEFSSARRRMSVIVRTPEGAIKLLSKGADMAITCRLNSRDKNQCKEETLNYLKTFSREGYRTLMVAERELSIDEYNQWKDQFFQANTAIENREERVEAVCELIERDMTLIGTTAIEDKLQYNVPETISYLLEAGLHIWVLTGDKQETAVNIGYSCRLFDPSMELIFINTESSEECGEILDRYVALLPPEVEEDTGVVTVSGAPPPEIMIPQLATEYGMVIDGQTLSYALHDHRDKFLRLGRACKSVICCRVTPLQKALVVRVVKESEQKISLAIGDGANDVSMIQEAHVGVGVFGMEGTQAARASDYAIHQFHHLKRLLCVHGRYSYLRVAGLIQYSFYKNMCFTLCLFWFSFFSLFTGQTIFDSWIITFYNILFTSLPPFFYGLVEKDIDDTSIMSNPLIYRRLQLSPIFTKKTFLMWNIAALWHSLTMFFGFYLLMDNDIMGPNGHTSGIWTFGTLVSTAAILVSNFKIAVEIKTWNLFNVGSILFSFLVYFIMLMLYSYVRGLNSNMFDIFSIELKTVSYHLTILIIILIALVPDFIFKYSVNITARGHYTSINWGNQTTLVYDIFIQNIVIVIEYRYKNIHRMIIISVLIGIIIILLLHYVQTRKIGPPGPFSFPIIGSLHLIANGQPQIGLHKLYQKYGPIFSMWLGSVYTVVLSEPEVINEAFTNQSDIFSDRHMNLSMHIVGDSNNIGFTNGDHWRKLRGIAAAALTKSKSRKMDTLICKQFENMASALKEEIKKGQPIDMRPFLKMTAFNVMFSFLFSKEAPFNPEERSEEVHQILHNSVRMVNLMAAGNPGDYIPFLNYFNNLRELRTVTNGIVEFARVNVKEHLQTIDRNNPRDFIDYLIIEYEADRDSDRILDYSCLERICIDLIVGGTDTGSTAIEWLILLLANNPEHQDMVYKELATNYVEDKSIDFSKKILFPITNSLIREGWRYRPTAPLGLPHKCTQNTTVGGYFIPKDSQVIINLYSASLSEKIWSNPLIFDPTRFIESDKNTTPPIVFGNGPRRCVGSNLAEVEAFLLTANIFRTFKFVRPTDDLFSEKTNMGVTLEPLPFKVKVEVYSNGLTPGTYSHIVFPPGNNNGFKKVEFEIVVFIDPGSYSNVFWSNQFSLLGSNGYGYTGLQTIGENKRTFIFSIWDAESFSKGSQGSYCTRFEGEGIGYHCNYDFNWREGDVNKFILYTTGDGWYTVNVTINSTTKFTIGSIKTLQSTISPHSMINWVEYFEWNYKDSNCYNQPYSISRFATPIADDHINSTVSRIWVSKNCQHLSKVEEVSNGSIHFDSVGNSKRDSIRLWSNGSLCIGTANNNTSGDVVMKKCVDSWDELLVFSDYHSLISTKDDTCLSYQLSNNTINKYTIIYEKCREDNIRQQWKYSSENNLIINKDNELCLVGNQLLSNNNNNNNNLKLDKCNINYQFQQWFVAKTK